MLRTLEQGERSVSNTWHHGAWNYKKGPPSKRMSHLIVYNRMWSYREPKWWRKLMKHRKRRASLSSSLARLKKGSDPEDMVWPLDSKPWIYYW